MTSNAGHMGDIKRKDLGDHSDRHIQSGAQVQHKEAGLVEGRERGGEGGHTDRILRAVDGLLGAAMALEPFRDRFVVQEAGLFEGRGGGGGGHTNRIPHAVDGLLGAAVALEPFCKGFVVQAAHGSHATLRIHESTHDG